MRASGAVNATEAAATDRPTLRRRGRSRSADAAAEGLCGCGGLDKPAAAQGEGGEPAEGEDVEAEVDQQQAGWRFFQPFQGGPVFVATQVLNGAAMRL
jgi:hypothetical protein